VGLVEQVEQGKQPPKLTRDFVKDVHRNSGVGHSCQERSADPSRENWTRCPTRQTYSRSACWVHAFHIADKASRKSRASSGGMGVFVKEGSVNIRPEGFFVLARYIDRHAAEHEAEAGGQGYGNGMRRRRAYLCGCRQSNSVPCVFRRARVP
jgi:hypothetical protein